MTDNNEATTWNGVMGGGNTATQAQCASEKAELTSLVLAAASAATAGAAIAGISLWGWAGARRDAEIARSRNQANR